MFTQWLLNLKNAWLVHGSAWVIFFVYLALTWFAASVARRVMKGLVTRLTARSSTTLDDRLVQASVGPVRLMVLAAGLWLALGSLGARIPAFGPGGRMHVEFEWVAKAAGAVVILAVTHLLNGLLKAALDWYLHELATQSDATWDQELLPVVRRVLSLLLYFIAISIILKNFGQDITALVTTAGVASLAVALAAQDTLSNMLGGLVILVDRPFRVGDVIELADGRAGEVKEIGLRSTRIQQFDGNALVVPNKDMASSRVINYALPTHRAAIRQTISVHYDTDIEKAKAVLLQVITSHPEVLPDPAPGVWFTKFNESGLDLFMSCWVQNYRDRFRVTDELNTAILKAFREAGIRMAYPTRDVHLHSRD
jgi:MscS family membrane protein